jgi:hypothetical protein
MDVKQPQARIQAVPCLVPLLQVSPVNETQDGLYTATLWPGHVQGVVHAVDPDGGDVVMEGQLVAAPGAWVPAHTTLSGRWADLSSDVRVASVRVDLVMPPGEFVAFVPSLDGVRNTGVEFWQASRHLDRVVHLAGKRGTARRSAFAGLDIQVWVLLPHEGEVASLTAPTSDRVEAALDRIRRAVG